MSLKRNVYSLRLVREYSAPLPQGYQSPMPARSPREVYTLLAPLAEIELTEVFWVLHLDAKHHVMHGGPVAVSKGILQASLTSPREVFRGAILAGAAAVILAHNHPSGDPTPSADDRLVTEQLVAAGRLLDIPVHDHIVIGNGRYVSFAEAGLL